MVEYCWWKFYEEPKLLSMHKAGNVEADCCHSTWFLGRKGNNESTEMKVLDQVGLCDLKVAHSSWKQTDWGTSGLQQLAKTVFCQGKKLLKIVVQEMVSANDEHLSKWHPHGIPRVSQFQNLYYCSCIVDIEADVCLPKQQTKEVLNLAVGISGHKTTD